MSSMRLFPRLTLWRIFSGGDEAIPLSIDTKHGYFPSAVVEREQVSAILQSGVISAVHLHNFSLAALNPCSTSRGQCK